MESLRFKSLCQYHYLTLQQASMLIVLVQQRTLPKTIEQHFSPQPDDTTQIAFSGNSSSSFLYLSMVSYSRKHIRPQTTKTYTSTPSRWPSRPKERARIPETENRSPLRFERQAPLGPLSSKSHNHTPANDELAEPERRESERSS